MNSPCTINNLSTADWLKARQCGIGSSEIASVLGIGFETPHELYARKVADTVPTRTPNERMELGTILEPYIAARYTRETGTPIEKGPQLAWRADRAWQMASGEYVAADRLVEIKAVFSSPSYPWGDAGSDHVPDYYLMQVQQQAGVYGAEKVDVGALFVGVEFRRYTVPFDPELFDILTEAGAEFWELVRRREGISLDWHSSYAPAVESRLLKLREGLEIDLGPDAESLAIQYRQFSQIKKEAEQQQTACKEKLIAMMGEATRGNLPSGTVLTQKLIKRAGYVVQPTEYIRFECREPKQRKAAVEE